MADNAIIKADLCNSINSVAQLLAERDVGESHGVEYVASAHWRLDRGV